MFRSMFTTFLKEIAYGEHKHRLAPSRQIVVSHLAAFDTVKGKNNVNMFASELCWELVTQRRHAFHQSSKMCTDRGISLPFKRVAICSVQFYTR